MAADVVVVNHHLFFADLALRDTGVAELLPTVRRRGLRRGAPARRGRPAVPGPPAGAPGRCIDFARDLLAGGPAAGARPAATGRQLAAGGRARRARPALLAAACRRAAVLRWPHARAGPMSARCAGTRPLAGLARSRRRRRPRRWARWPETGPDFARLVERARALARLAGSLRAPRDRGQVRWIDLSAHQARLVESPLDIRGGATLLSAEPAAEPARLDLHLGHAGRRRQPELVHRAVRPGARRGSCVWAARSTTRRQAAAVRAARRCPRPNDPGHSGRSARWSRAWPRALGGRTFVLTTTLRVLRVDRRGAAAPFRRARRSCRCWCRGRGRNAS